MSKDENILEKLRTMFGEEDRKVQLTPELEECLKACWEHFKGSTEQQMASWKLDRIEDVSWSPPVLSFVIERHGNIQSGSSRAELQQLLILKKLPLRLLN